MSDEAKILIKALNDRGFTDAYIERVLELPSRTLARVKIKGCSSALLVLLKIIHIYPWILGSAEKEFSIYPMLHAAVDAMEFINAERITDDET